MTKMPVFGLEAAPHPSWLEEEESPMMETSQQTSGSLPANSSSNNGDGDARAYIYFTTDLPDPLKLSQEPLSVETSMRRSHLSKLVNRLLQEQAPDAWPHPQPLDFLVGGDTLLQGSLSEHMQKHGLTAEVSIQLHYQLATRKGTERVLPPARDWISGVCVPYPEGPIVESSYDGHVRLHSAASCGALFSSPSPPLISDVSLGQGPLAGVCCVGVGEGGPSGSRLPLTCFAATQGGGLLGLSLTPVGASEWSHALSLTAAHGGPAACVAAAADGALAAVGGEDGVITLWDTRPAAAAAAAAAAATAGEGPGKRQKRRLVADGGGSLVALKSPSVRIPASGASSAAVTCVEFGRSEGFEDSFVSCGLDGHLRLWKVSGEEAASWKPETIPLSVACSPKEGQLLAAAHEDGAVRLWDVRTPEGAVAGSSGTKETTGASLRLRFKARHSRMPTAVSWSSSDPHLLASVGQDGCVMVQDVRSAAAALVVFKAEAGGLPVRLLCCSWLGGDAGIVSGGSDGRVRLHGLLRGAHL